MQNCLYILFFLLNELANPTMQNPWVLLIKWHLGYFFDKTLFIEELLNSFLENLTDEC